MQGRDTLIGSTPRRLRRRHGFGCTGLPDPSRGPLEKARDALTGSGDGENE